MCSVGDSQAQHRLPGAPENLAEAALFVFLFFFRMLIVSGQAYILIHVYSVQPVA